MALDVTAVAIVGTVFGTGIALAAMLTRHAERKLELSRAGSSEGDAALKVVMAELADVRERVKVLERLATDEDRKLAQDIERLRADGASAGR